MDIEAERKAERVIEYLARVLNSQDQSAAAEQERKLILAVNGGLQLMESLLAEAGAPVRNPTVPPPEPRVPSAVADDGHRPDNLILFEGVQHG